MEYIIFNLFRQQTNYNLELRNKNLETINIKLTSNQYKIGDFVDVTLINNKYIINEKLNTPTNYLDFYLHGKDSYEELVGKMSDYLEQIKDEDYRIILEELIFKNDDFFIYPAAKTLHHAFIGGLARHTLDMLEMSIPFIDKYDLNKDLMFTAIMLHDSGKTRELSDYGITYSFEGNLLGHIMIAYEEISRISYELGINQKNSIVILKHLILSHHGRLDYGSPKEPMIKEALVISVLDDMDAKLNHLNKALKLIEPGESTAPLMAMDRKKFVKI